ncbi:MAG: carboxymuconolactone decarboxylase family protein [Anaerolineales bacterium]|jgi:AhpD family alkylhydroperoxidase
MAGFNRRLYRSLNEFLTDVRILVSRRKDIRTLVRGDVVAPAFRERLMLTVTAVNRCRYCSYGHARAALSQGISGEEIEALGKGLFEGSPAEEIPAMLYAQHWAEMDAEPEPQVREQVAARYGENVLAMIELALRMIRVGNLTGNTFDYLLHRISFGRWGAWGKQIGPP